MCLSAAVWAGYSQMAYIIPANKYINKIPWMAETKDLDKHNFIKHFSHKIEYVHLVEYEEEFSKVFEEEMRNLLK